MATLSDILGEYKDLESKQYVTQEPMSLDQVEELPEIEELGAVSMNQEMEGMTDSGAGEVERLETMMSELEGKGTEPKYMQELSEERDVMQANQYEEDDQKAIDSLSFNDAFNQHYEQYKDTPIEERPYLKWKERDYLPYKADEKSIKPEKSIAVSIPKKFKSSKTILNENLEGYISSANDKLKAKLGGLGNVRLTGADKEKGHGKKTVQYVDLNDGAVSTYNDINLGYDFRPDNGKINSFMSGEVVSTGISPDSPGHGNSVVVKTPRTVKIGDVDYEMYYAIGHMKNIDKSVKEGSSVTEGVSLGNEGSTGGNYKKHGDIRTFLLPKGSKFKKDHAKKLYVNPIQGYNYTGN